MELGKLIPILRSFEETKAKEFYCDFLGFKIDFEHRFAADLPLYLQVSRDGVAVHLTEHHGDVTPGGAVRIEVDDIDALHAELTAKNYKYARPGIEEQPWGYREVSVKDPFGNRVTFAQDMQDGRELEG
jgi:uncharacterized glyoxalase superfamily protein PhnB